MGQGGAGYRFEAAIGENVIGHVIRAPGDTRQNRASTGGAGGIKADCAVVMEKCGLSSNVLFD